MRVRLIKKLAQRIDGVDLSAYEPGSIVDLTRWEARLLLAEGWAVPEDGAPTGKHRTQNAASASHLTPPLGTRAADQPRSNRPNLRRPS